MNEIKVGDLYETKSVRHKVVEIEDKRVQLKALGNGYLFWLSIETIKKYWLQKKVTNVD